VKNKICVHTHRMVVVLAFMLGAVAAGYAAGEGTSSVAKPVSPAVDAAKKSEPAITQKPAISQNVTLDFNDADIRNVLKIISYKSGVNIVTTAEVIGNVTIRLVDVPWEKALEVILSNYGFGFERRGNIIMVAPIDKLTSQKKQEVELAQVQPTQTEVFNLLYIDARDAKKALEPLLSPRGKITMLEMTGQSGWEFGKVAAGSTSDESSALKRIEKESIGRSKIIIVNDIPPVMDKIREVINQIDIVPQQVVIEARIMEVSRDKLRDIGLDWGTSSSGATTSTITAEPIRYNASRVVDKLGGNLLGSQVKPSVFNPKTTTITGKYPFNAGLNLLFQKLNGFQYEIVLHALEEDVHTNTLSAPRIMVLNNQEATMLIGTKYPILEQSITGVGTSAVTTVTLQNYQDIGIQLKVVPQIGINNAINMVVHPVVSSYSDTLGDNAYPIIQIREAETRILLKDGETVAMGGLLKDVRSKSDQGIPFLKDVPFLGVFFRRETTDTEKIDLLIFISARIVKDNEFTPQKIEQLEQALGGDSTDKKKASAKKKAKKKDV